MRLKVTILAMVMKLIKCGRALSLNAKELCMVAPWLGCIAFAVLAFAVSEMFEILQHVHFVDVAQPLSQVCQRGNQAAVRKKEEFPSRLSTPCTFFFCVLRACRPPRTRVGSAATLSSIKSPSCANIEVYLSIYIYICIICIWCIAADR